MAQRRSGTIFIKADGQQFDVVGNFDYNHGAPMREALVGHDKVHGFKEVPQVPFIEGEIRDSADLDVAALKALEDVTITLELANGKIFILRNAWFAGEGNVGTEEANIAVRFEGISGEEA